MYIYEWIDTIGACIYSRFLEEQQQKKVAEKKVSDEHPKVNGILTLA